MSRPDQPITDYFDVNWRPLSVRGHHKPNSTVAPAGPKNLPYMVGLAEVLSEGFEFCRVDLYNINGKIYFGEITHYPAAGVVRFIPPDFDLALGETWRKGTAIPERFYRASNWPHEQRCGRTTRDRHA